MDEYCARYGVRGVIRQILYLNELLDHAEKGSMIDPTLLHFCYAYVSSHNYGNSPEGYQTVTVNEMAQFYSVRERLQSYLESQLANIRYSFPFGRPEGALKATLSLLERVIKTNCFPSTCYTFTVTTSYSGLDERPLDSSSNGGNQRNRDDQSG